MMSDDCTSNPDLCHFNRVHMVYSDLPLAQMRRLDILEIDEALSCHIYLIDVATHERILEFTPFLIPWFWCLLISEPI